ncbi:PREDICTED: centromere protein K-like [Branchiostoma belcheri]|uniref:Centromere protein K-like n=1 Tax=Branchiostoma belcheri TaxID=7741 RepID=A0A6P4Z6U3_BRABE|nr:PREDICTED: centromere protein K-like [Branchiostoma belcheri]
MGTPVDCDRVSSISTSMGNSPDWTPLASAQCEMKQECVEVWRDVNMVQQSLDEETAGAGPADSHCPLLAVSRAKQLQLQAQVEVLESQQPQLMSTHKKVIEAVLVNLLQESLEQLAELLPAMKVQQKELSASLELEEQLLEQRQEIGRMLESRLAEVPEAQETSVDSRVKTFRRKIKAAEQFHGNLVQSLAEFLDTHFPPPQPGKGKGRRRHGSGPVDRTLDVDDPQWETLNNMIETLICKSMDSPHDPYIPMEPRYWPPYVEMLLRCGIAQRHPEDSGRFKLAPFDL